MVYILGCDHYLQDYDLQDYTEEIRKIERELKERFYSITEEIIRAKAITFVGEECKPAHRNRHGIRRTRKEASRRTTTNWGVTSRNDAMNFAKTTW
jgi:hypothetical protein